MKEERISIPDSTLAGQPTANWAIRRRLKEYATVGRTLFLQRIVIYSAAIMLAGAYYNPYIAAGFYAAVWVCEAYDWFVFRNILRRRNWCKEDIRRSMRMIYTGTFISSVTISLFSISVATQQDVGTGHFLPLFLLVSASIFAAMNNHHFLPVLGLRLTIYIVTVVFIPLRDVWIVSPPLSSEIWLNLFSVLFVLGFIMELSRSFLVGYSRYLSSRKELEEEHKQTKAAYEAKTRFLATVSHELRTPLTSIKGALEMVNSGALGQPPDKMQIPLEIAMRNSLRLHDLVRDLLFIQSSEVGKIDFKFERFDLGKLVQEVIERFQPYAAKLSVEIRADVKAEEYWISGDGKRIDQVITNILSNAAKFSENNGTIDVSMESLGDAVKLSVKDEGIGIADGLEDDVFAEFTQLDSQDNRKFGGTGLGLSISKRIVEAHGGKIGYTSEIGTGTTFFVELQKAAFPTASKLAKVA
tara:strand:+ start:730 stop:2136 length:1407 start_codon:yes stop_codon:yes gene_type:complete